MRESFARKIPTTPEEEPVESLPEAANDNDVAPVHMLHPETANDNESSQPISTIYPETMSNRDTVAETIVNTLSGVREAPLEPANDMEEINAEEIEAIRASLRQHAHEAESAEHEEVPLILREEELEKEAVAESTPGHANIEHGEQQPRAAQAAGGAEEKDDGNGEGPKRPRFHAVESGGSGEERQKGWLSRALGGFFKTIVWVGAVIVWASTTLVRKTTESAFKGFGYKDGASGGGGGAKKPASSGSHGGGGGGGHH